MYFHCVFFYTILTMAQNTQRAYLTVIPECYSGYFVVFPICISPGMFCTPQGDNTKNVHPIELVMLKLLFCSKLYSGSEYTDTVSSFGFIPLAPIVHTCI